MVYISYFLSVYLFSFFFFIFQLECFFPNGYIEIVIIGHSVYLDKNNKVSAIKNIISIVEKILGFEKLSDYVKLTFPMNNTRTTFFIVFSCYPFILESIERSQYRSSNPYTVFSLGWCYNTNIRIWWAHCF